MPDPILIVNIASGEEVVLCLELEVQNCTLSTYGSGAIVKSISVRLRCDLLIVGCSISTADQCNYSCAQSF